MFPSEFLLTEQLVPQPVFEAVLSETNIDVGDSFRLSIVSENIGDYADIHIVSIAFPDLIEIDDVVKIATYDFTLSPSEYPSIEAMSRPLKSDVETYFDVVVTPKKSGIFDVYVKSIGIPHSSDLSHYPHSGTLDHQNEHVLVYSVTVNP